MLLNENHIVERDNQCIYLAGIDDAHFYRVDNIEKAATGIPFGNFSILLSHTPEVYQQASYADFGLLLSGHTPWRANLPARQHCGHFEFCTSTTYGFGRMEVP
jgi:hypothetical protein